jgi:hypothetical protein
MIPTNERAVTLTDPKITLSIKSGTGYDAGLIAIKTDTANEARDILGEIEASGLLVDIGRVAQAFASESAIGSTLGGRPVNAPQSAPQPQQAPQPPQGYGQPPQAPQGQPWTQGGGAAPAQQWGNSPGANPADNKACIHGPMNYKPAGVSRRTNQPYSAFWACGSNVKGCKPVN